MVTGGTGFIGGRFSECMAREGAVVHLLARDREKADRAREAGYRVTLGDLGDPDAIREVTRGCDQVYHCAHTFSLGMADAIRVNVGGTRNLLEAARDEGVSRFIYLSSASVYGQTPPDPTDESRDIPLTGDPYSDSKILAEQEVISFSKKFGLPVVILRPAIVYGPASRVWSIGIIEALQAKHPIVVGNGDGICNSLYIDNLVDAMILAGTVDGVEGEAFIITDGEPCTWGEYVGYYARMLGMESPPSCPTWLAHIVAYKSYFFYVLLEQLRDTPSWEPARFLVRGSRFALRTIRELFLRVCAFLPRHIQYFTHRAAFDIRKSREILGYQPRVRLEEGMARTEVWLRSEGYLDS
jgi:nucleoside-diphosphate-sugar epimerase